MQTNELMLIALLGAHFFFDFAGQGDFMAKAKNEHQRIPGVPWFNVMSAHCAIHGAAAALITGIWWIFWLEFIAHLWTDCAKCDGKISFRMDQFIHLACKFAWFGIAVWAA
jgi:hypothetical protein